MGKIKETIPQSTGERNPTEGLIKLQPCVALTQARYQSTPQEIQPM